MAAPLDLIRRVPLFEQMKRKDLERLADVFKQRTFRAGDEIATEGEKGVGFFVVENGEAKVTIGGRQVSTIGAGDYFGEIALIDEGTRTATITATSDLKCYGLTPWEFRPLVEENASIAWELLKVLAKRLREAQQRAG